MSLRFLRNFVWLVVFIMIFECVSSALAPIDKCDTQNLFFKKSVPPDGLESLFFEKAEEETSEEESDDDHLPPILLADFSRIAYQLSNVHSHYIPYLHLEKFSKRPPLFELFCTYLI